MSTYPDMKHCTGAVSDINMHVSKMLAVVSKRPFPSSCLALLKAFPTPTKCAPTYNGADDPSCTCGWSLAKCAHPNP